MTKRRPRRKPEPGEFEDPLSNYDSPRYDDGLERSVCEDHVAKVIKIEPYMKVEASVTVGELVRDMVDKDVAAVVITQNDKPVGILTERDFQNNMAQRYDELVDQPVSEVMTKDPRVVYGTDSPSLVMNMMTNGNFRHIPVVDVDGKLIGIIGPTRLTSYLKQYFTDVPSA